MLMQTSNIQQGADNGSGQFLSECAGADMASPGHLRLPDIPARQAAPGEMRAGREEHRLGSLRDAPDLCHGRHGVSLHHGHAGMYDAWRGSIDWRKCPEA